MHMRTSFRAAVNGAEGALSARNRGARRIRPRKAALATLAFSGILAATLSAGLFAALRELDSPTVHHIYARCPVGGGIAYAVQNRLKKAAAFQIVDAEAEA